MKSRQVNLPEIVGRHTSHFTRLVLIAAHELDVDYSFTPVYDLMDLDPQRYGSHPGLRLPTLRLADEVVFGSVNICRRLADIAERKHRIAWPDAGNGDILSANMHEITMQAMASQVSIIIATQIAKLDPDNDFTIKRLTGMKGMLCWLDAHIQDYRERLPSDRLISITEIALFCLYEHILFRRTISVDGYRHLAEFAGIFGNRSSATETPYRLDRKGPDGPE